MRVFLAFTLSLIVALCASATQATECDYGRLASVLDAIDPPLTDIQRAQLLSGLTEASMCAAGPPTASTPPGETDNDAAPSQVASNVQKSSAWPSPKREEFIIRDRIDGPFKGWRGKTLFRLANGQTWVQRQRGYHRADLDSPEIAITKNALGFFVLEVVSSGRKVPVKPYRK